MTTAREAGFVTCRICSRVWDSAETECGRCGAALQSRDTRSLDRVWAWWCAGLICYIPANLYPMLVTETLTSRTSDTIVAGAIEIAKYGDLGIALIVLTASVVIPVAKFIAIAYLALSVGRGSVKTVTGRMRLYEVIEFIGRWSMIDVFVVAILSALVQLSVVASIEPGPAVLTFALSVIFTMLSAKSFDTRLIWDTPKIRQAGPI
ncbi:MAG: paraquat-inducible protein A [Pseudomonadota bacterium]